MGTKILLTIFVLRFIFRTETINTVQFSKSIEYILRVMLGLCFLYTPQRDVPLHSVECIDVSMLQCQCSQQPYKAAPP